MTSKHFFLSSIMTVFLVSGGCASTRSDTYLLELTGRSGVQCKITHDHRVIGTFVVPSEILLGPEVRTIQASCELDRVAVVSEIRAPDFQCHDRMVVKGGCSMPTGDFESVEIRVKRAK